MLGNYLLCWNMLYYSVGVLDDDTLVVQGFFLQHMFFGHQKTLVYFFLQFKYFLLRHGLSFDN